MANEQIDPRMVRWDAPQESGIDPRLVKWEGQPQRTQHIPGPTPPDVSGFSMAPTILGLGRAADKAAVGLEALFASPERQAQITAEQKEADRLYKPAQEQHPFQDIMGQGIFYGAAQNPLSMAALAYLQHAPTQKERFVNAGETFAGAKIGEIGGRMLGRAITPADAVSNKAQQEALKVGREQGYKALPSMKTGSKAQQMIEAGAESNIFSTSKISNIKMMNQTKLNREFNKAMGIIGDDVDEKAVASAIQKVNQTYQSVAKKVPAQFNVQNASSALQNVVSDTRGLVKDFAQHELVQDANTYLTQGATSEQLVALATKLRQAAESQVRSAQGDRALGHALSKVKMVVDDAIKEGLSPAERTAFEEARKSWKYILLAMKPGVVNTASGDVSGNMLYNALKESEIKALSRGADPSPLVAGAKMQKAFPAAFGRSGTAERLSSPGRLLGEKALSTALYNPYLSDLGMMWAGNTAFGPVSRGVLNAISAGSGGSLAQQLIPQLFQPNTNQEQ